MSRACKLHLRRESEDSGLVTGFSATLDPDRARDIADASTHFLKLPSELLGMNEGFTTAERWNVDGIIMGFATPPDKHSSNPNTARFQWLKRTREAQGLPS